MAAIRKKFIAGDVIFSEGSIGNTFFYIESGKLEVSKMVGAKKEVMAVLGKGETFGEFALLSEGGQKRSGTVKSLEDSQLVVIDRLALENTLTSVPQFLKALLNSIISKLVIMEDRCLKAENGSLNINLNRFLDLLAAQKESMIKSFSIQIKKYPQEQRKAIISSLDSLINVVKAQDKRD